MASLIDPPGPFAPRTELESFLVEMRRRGPEDRSAKFAIDIVEGYLKLADKYDKPAKPAARRKG
jgi:hypothetical protein